MKQFGLSVLQNAELPGILLACIGAVCALFLLFRLIPLKDLPEKDSRTRVLRLAKPSRVYRSLNRSDWLSMSTVTAVYAIVSLWKLGSPVFPVTTWQPTSETGEQDTVFMLEEETAFDAVYAIYGEGDTNALEDGYQLGFHNIQIYGSSDYQNWEEIGVLEGGSIYQYTILSGSWDYRWIWLHSASRTDTVSEIGVRSAEGNHFIHLSLYADGGAGSAYPGSLMIDEQEKLVLTPTYYDEGYFDEVYHPRNAWEIANGQYMYATVHPLLGTNIMALFIRLFGMSPLVWRLPGAIAGILMVPLMYMTAKLLFEKTVWCTAAAVLTAGDFMHLTTSRIGTLEPFSILFIMMMYYYMIRYFFTSFYDTELKDTLKLLLKSGVWAGIAIAAKWTGCYGAVGLALILFANWYLRFREYRTAAKVLKENTADRAILEEAEHITKTFRSCLIRTILLCFVFFIFIPAAIYWLSYLPDHVWRNDSWSIANVWKQNLSMYSYHKNLEATHPYQSSWYQWVTDARPIWYYYGVGEDGALHTISCFSNPLLTWAGLAAAAALAYGLAAKKEGEAWIIAVGIATALGPWMTLVSRCVFAYHYYPTSIFTALSVVYLFRLLHAHDEKWMSVLYAFLAAYVILFIGFLPVTAGFATAQSWIKLLEWFPTWYFG